MRDVMSIEDVEMHDFVKIVDQNEEEIVSGLVLDVIADCIELEEETKTDALDNVIYQTIHRVYPQSCHQIIKIW